MTKTIKMIKSLLYRIVYFVFGKFGYSVININPFPPIFYEKGFCWMRYLQKNPPPPNRIPDDLFDHFTMNGKIPVIYSYLDGSGHDYILECDKQFIKYGTGGGDTQLK